MLHPASSFFLSCLSVKGPVLMLMWLRRSRLLRLVLVTFMVPLMLLTSSNAATAAGVWQKTRHQIDFDGIRGVSAYGTVRCDLETIRESVGRGDIQIRGVCRGSVDLSPGWAQPGEPGSPYRVRFVGDGCAGVSTEGLLSDHSADGWARVAGQFGPYSVGGSNCAPAEVCIALNDDKRSAGGEYPWRESCAAVSMPVLEAECLDGAVRVNAPVLAEPYDRFIYTEQRQYDWHAWMQKATLGYEIPVEGTWRMYAVIGPPGLVQEETHPYQWEHYGTTSASAWATLRDIPYTGAVEPMRIITTLLDSSGAPLEGWIETALSQRWRQTAGNGPFAPDGQIMGVGIFRVEGNLGLSARVPEVEGSGPEAQVGVHDLGRCAFYWGDKLWDDGSPGGVDEPAGSLVQPSPPGEEPPVEDDDDQEPDESNWWSALLELMRQLVGAVFALPGKIISGIGGLLRDLFIPADGFLDDGLQELRDQADDSNIGDWNDAFAGLFSAGASGKAGVPAVGGESLAGRTSATAQSAPSGLDFGGGGCQGPSVDIGRIIPDGMGSEMDTIHPFSACEGITAEMAGWSRLLSSLFIALFGGFKMFGYVASASFGLKQTEIMRGFDWQSDRLDGRSM